MAAQVELPNKSPVLQAVWRQTEASRFGQVTVSFMDVEHSKFVQVQSVVEPKGILEGLPKSEREHGMPRASEPMCILCLQSPQRACWPDLRECLLSP